MKFCFHFLLFLLCAFIECSLAQWWDSDIFDNVQETFRNNFLASTLLNSRSRLGTNTFNPWMQHQKPVQRRRNWWEKDDDDDDNRMFSSRHINQRGSRNWWDDEEDDDDDDNLNRFSLLHLQNQRQGRRRPVQRRWGRPNQALRQNTWRRPVQRPTFPNWRQTTSFNRRPAPQQNHWGSFAAQSILFNDIDVPDFGFDSFS